ncbi:cardiolipin synthase [Hydrogenovibrio sp. SC-1]|uniref:cardiolipin synthase n=1 Tax=Hydrogenovibrio sp. SC-1 TaxID=2065820 RepID=UPI000C7980B5|nr:cardiolipin synthase [Hydrogenovibrio sp. SC-1]PLA73932.1 cardiolipin synthase [Hydrogenovibrio sp. SC-1]
MFSIEQWALLAYGINLLLVLSILFFMLYQRRSPQSLTTWGLTLFLLPFFGVLLYLVLGSRKLLYKKNKPNILLHPLESPPSNPSFHAPLPSAITQLLYANQIDSVTYHNTIAFIAEPEEAYQQLLKAIHSAKTAIYIETYVFELDETGHAILNALTEKAKQGVEVRILFDAVGTLNLYLNARSLAEFKRAGGRYGFFQPLFKGFLSRQMNLRNHRKIFIFDGQITFTGGMNLSQDYMGQTSSSERPFWIDTLFKIKGASVNHHQTIFMEDWFYTSQERLTPIAQDSSHQIDHNHATSITTIPSGPDINSDALFESFLLSIHAAQKNLIIASPYFIPDSAIMNALMMALKRGVNVCLITNQTSDHLIFDLGSASFIRQLLEAGGNVYCFPSRVMHAKLMIIDQQAAFFGSANLDYRSLFLNYEISHFVSDSQLIKTLMEWVEIKIQEAETYQPSQHKVHRFFENLTRVFAPLL